MQTKTVAAVTQAIRHLSQRIVRGEAFDFNTDNGGLIS